MIPLYTTVGQPCGLLGVITRRKLSISSPNGILQMKMPIHIDGDDQELEIHRIMNIIFQCRENRMREWIWHSTKHKYFFFQNWTKRCKISPSPKLPRSNYFPLSLISHCTVSLLFTYFFRHSYSARGWSKDRNHHTTISKFSYGGAKIVFLLKNMENLHSSRFLAARAALNLHMGQGHSFIIIIQCDRRGNARASGQIASNCLTHASWRLYRIRQPPTFSCTTPNFLRTGQDRTGQDRTWKDRKAQ